MTTTQSAAQKEAQNRSNLITRLITALILAPLVLGLVYFGGVAFMIGAGVFAALALVEFYALGRTRDIQGNYLIGMPLLAGLLLAFISGQGVLIPLILLLAGGLTFVVEVLRGTAPTLRVGRALVTAGGLAYAGLPAAFMMGVRGRPDGLIWMVAIIVVTWGTDTLAYFGGRWWGRTPLAPRISPKKTREGAITGVVAGFFFGIVDLLAGGKLTPATVGLMLFAPVAAVLGDLAESALKRYFSIGDSHIVGLNLIPGHGGILDRTDALVWVTTLVYVFLALTGT